MTLLTQKQCEDLGWVFKTDGYFKHAIKEGEKNGATAKSITGLRMRITFIEQNLSLKLK